MTPEVLALAGVVLNTTALAACPPARTRPRLAAWRTGLLAGGCVLAGIAGALDGHLWLCALFGIFAAAGTALELGARRARRKLKALRAVLAELAEGGPE